MSDLKTIIAAEEAKRAELEGKGYTCADFRKNRRNYLVEAGAGAGKTFIMVQRIVNQLVSGFCEPEDVVAITFTNKSTLELRERLDSQLSDRRKKLLDKGISTEEDQKLLSRLEYLIQESGRMQVSTIHSFCRTMLDSMPFASPLGLDMTMLEDEAPLAKDFLRLKLRRNPQLFRKARDFGLTVRTLQDVFVQRCANSEATIVYCSDPRKIAQWEQEAVDAAVSLKEALADTQVVDWRIRKDIIDIMGMDEADLRKDADALRALMWASLSEPNYLPADRDVTSSQKSGFAKTKKGQLIHAVWTGPKNAELRRLAGQLLHSYIMCDMVPLVEEFRAEKARQHIATFNDLLLRARDMLRDNAEARAYFHDRYKVLYVDEMQDTDPVQAEFLFYLTTAEKDFDGTNWQNCKPEPGRLFLVGDPKQAIYRFRGADIDVYNTLLRLFRGNEPGSVGEKVTLQFNFRSAAEICALTDKIFTPPKDPAEIKSKHFVGGKYHAEYVPMIARNGECLRARTVQYVLGAGAKDDDPIHVAAFIKTMIIHKLPVGIRNPKFGKLVRHAQPGDFLILTSDKDHITAYTEALNAFGIPVQVTGEKSYSDTPPIRKAVLHLRSLLNLRSDPLLMRVLRDCYEIEDESIRVFLQRTGEFSLSGAVKLDKLQKIHRALEAEAQPDAKLLHLTAALEEIACLRRAAAREPAMAVIERLLEGGYGVWNEVADHYINGRRKTYSEIQQYLNLVRKSRERSFPALAAYAIECADKEYAQDLDLEPQPNAVRIMNLHKAKGLEGEIVILAYSRKKPHPASRQIMRRGNQAEEYAALLHKPYAFVPANQVAFPENWKTIQQEEDTYLEAEYARLLYVAATRAKTMLVIFNRDSNAGDWREKKFPSYWEPLLDDVKEADPADPDYGKAFAALLTGNVVEIPPEFVPQEKKAAAADNAGQAADDDSNVAPIPILLQPDTLESELRDAASSLETNSIYAITPSKLEKQARKPRQLQDEEEPEVAQSADAVADTTADGTDTAGTDVKDICITDADKHDIYAHKGPRGADWGTMVHRVMELCIREGSYRAAVLEEAARQAVREQLDEGFDLDNLWMVGLKSVEDEEAVLEKLVPEIEVAAAFLTSEISPLRQLIDGGDCYPELPFILRAEKDHEQTGEMYRHLSAHISDERAKNRTLAVEGIIDLAVRKDNAWYIVDYKTDAIKKTETKEDFVQRLRNEYTPQITAYARVLEKMNGEKSLPVKGAWLCSIPLGGELIELDITPKDAT